jgi:hypothetical protein
MAPERLPLTQCLDFRTGKDAIPHGLDVSLGYQLHGFLEFLLGMGANLLGQVATHQLAMVQVHLQLCRSSDGRDRRY